MAGGENLWRAASPGSCMQDPALRQVRSQPYEIFQGAELGWVPVPAQALAKYEEVFRLFSRRLFVGRFGQPGVINEVPSFSTPSELGGSTSLAEGHEIIDVGAVGKPRDQDPRACYLGPALGLDLCEGRAGSRRRSVVAIAFHKRDIAIRLAYCGPEGSGKTTNLRRLERDLDASVMTLSPLSHEAGEFWIMKCRVAGYSVAGMVTRFEVRAAQGEATPQVLSLLLQGVDAVAFVADSLPERMKANEESLRDLKEGLREKGKSERGTPFVFQWNKRDVKDPLPEGALNRALNEAGSPAVESVATGGEGVLETFHTLARLVTARLEKEYGLDRKKTRGALADRVESEVPQEPVQATPLAREPATLVDSSIPEASRLFPGRLAALGLVGLVFLMLLLALLQELL